MGLVSERVPTMNMLKEAHELIEHANYYRVIKGLGTDNSNEWLDIDEDTLCVFREVSFLDEKGINKLQREPHEVNVSQTGF